jgi:hypothetical protein
MWLWFFKKKFSIKLLEIVKARVIVDEILSLANVNVAIVK